MSLVIKDPLTNVMLVVTQKFPDIHCMSLLVFFSWSISNLAWFSGWSHVALFEGYGVLLLAFILHLVITRLARLIHEGNDRLNRLLYLALNDRREVGKLRDIPRDVLSEAFGRWSGRRIAYLLAGRLIADLPIIFYIGAIIVPSLPSPKTGFLILFVQTTSYLFIAAFLCQTEQMNLNNRLRRLISLELGWNEFAKGKVEKPVISEFYFSKSSLIAFCMAMIVGSFVALWGRVASDSFLPLLYSEAFLCMCFLWLLEKSNSRVIAGKIQDYDMEFKKSLSGDIETHRMSSLGHYTGLVIHDLAEQMASLKLSLESFGGVRVKSDVQDVQETDFAAVILVSKHMEVLLESLRAKLKNPGSPPIGQCRMGDAMDYALALLRISEGVAAANNWQAQMSYEARHLMIALPQSDLIQIVMNLGSNALRAMQGQSKIQFTVGVSSRDEKFVTLMMTDNGSGLTRERFDDLTAIANLGGEGSRIREGLGLRLVCRMVEHAGGSVTVCENSGSSGTTMYVKLPLA